MSPEQDVGQEGTLYTVKVDEVFRAKLPRRVRIFSENSTGRFPMDVDRRYLLSVYLLRGRTIVDGCGNSEIFNAKSSVLAAVRELKNN